MNARPIHPGEHVREYMESREWTVTELAKRLRIGRVATSNLVNRRAGISAPMALRLELVFSRPARFWLTLQLNYDLALAKRRRNS